jgi:hypothetical protein
MGQPAGPIDLMSVGRKANLQYGMQGYQCALGALMLCTENWYEGIKLSEGKNVSALKEVYIWEHKGLLHARYTAQDHNFQS